METTWTTGDWIRGELEKRGWTVDQLSFETRISVRLLWKYLAGTEPGAKNLGKILGAFGYDAPWSSDSRSTGLRPGSALIPCGLRRATPRDLALVGANG